MNIQFYTILISIVSMIHISCTTIAKQQTTDDNFYHLYQKARNQLLHANYNEAIQNLLKLQNLYLFEPYPQQISLDLIYAYYKTHDFQTANNYIHKFLKIYPNHKYLDYILYMHGIINMHLDRNNYFFLQRYLHIYPCDNDPVYANIAFRSLSKLIQNYPNSKYTFDSYKRLIFLKNRIAKYELHIIKFYQQKKAYLAVINRTEKMLHYFPDTQATYQALYYMKQAYQKIHLLDQANKVNTIIIENQKHIN